MEARLRAGSVCSSQWSCQAPLPKGEIGPNGAGRNEMAVSWNREDAAEDSARFTLQRTVRKDEQMAPHLKFLP